MLELQIESDGSLSVKEYGDTNLVSTAQYHSIDNLPEDIKTKMSALRLISPPDSIPDIGQRVSESIFWILNEGE